MSQNPNPSLTSHRRKLVACTTILASLLLPLPSFSRAIEPTTISKIVVQPELRLEKIYKLYDPIIIALGKVAPEGAKVRGSWQFSPGCQYLPGPEPYTIHVWAPPGSHTIHAFGVWVLTEDIEINGKIIQNLKDFGQYNIEKQFTVGGPVPPNPPEPGPDTAPFPSPEGLRILILEETTQRVHLPLTQQIILFGEEGRKLLQSATIDDGKTPGYRIWDDDFSETALKVTSETWRKAYAAAKKNANNKLPWIVIANKNKGFSGPLPESVSKLKQILEGLK